MADLQELFSRLKSSGGANGVSSSSSSNTGSQHPSNYQPPSVSSPIFSPPSHTPNPTGSAILSPKVSSTPVQDPKAANLLNLLRFNGRTPSQSSPLAALQNVGSSSESPSAGDVATMSGGPQLPKDQQGKGTGITASVGNAQDFLLNLLNQPSKPSTATSPLQAPQQSAQAGQPGIASSLAFNDEKPVIRSRETTPVRVFGSVESRETTPFNPPKQSQSSGMFTYVNPFEHLSASTPRSKSPKGPIETHALASKVAASPVRTPGTDSEEPRLAFKKTRTVKEPAAASPVIKQEPGEDIPDSWQNADSTTQPKAVQVFNFPMRPFVSIRIDKSPEPGRLGGTGVMDIVRLKKDFDQIDRVLVTASQSHIAYAMSKSGGVRIIRQDSGRDKQVFKSSQERIFHLQIKEAHDNSASDSLLAAGINGSVFWTRIDLSEEDKFQGVNLEASGLILPPISTQDENTSGSPVKTRSKMSSRHQDLFAISRGKSIHIVTPSVASSAKFIDSKSRVVDAVKYFQEKNLKISTGKACKDFTFSEDDTTIASLDKAGRIKFWDIKELSEAAKGQKRANIELKTSLLSFATTMASEKISPTSIMFVDKERPCVKGIALRYLLVGFKQNHSLQLWDLGLGKPVQELHFPHEKDSDAICSISYHPKTGIIALAHPTRNSIYFVHLSAPRYHIPNMDQAKYLSLLADNDPNLPKPESTAIMSGIRELSFSSKGQLRSVDMLANPASTNSDADGNDTEEALFELYAMHSTGVTCLNIKRADLGWGPDNKVIKPNDAEQCGFVAISPISAAVENSSGSESAPKVANKVSDALADKSREASPAKLPRTLPVRSSGSLQGKSQGASPGNSRVASPEKSSAALPVKILTPLTSAPSPQPKDDVVESIETPAEPVIEKHVNESSASRTTSLVDRTKDSEMFSDTLRTELEALYRRIEGDRRIQDAAANARQDAILKLVSSTLTDNVEKSLGKIVSDVLTSLVEGGLVQGLSQEMKPGLNSAVKAALQDRECLQSLHEPLSQRVLASMDGLVRQTIAPMISQTIAQTVTTTVQKTMIEAEARIAIQRAEQDSKLVNLVESISGSMQRMTTTLAGLQEQVSALQSQRPSDVPQSRSVVAVVDVVDEELDEVTSLMTEGRFEDGTIKWLQSSRQGELFDRLFVRVNPQYLQKLSPLVKLSVSAAVSSSFEQNVNQRLDWLGIILTSTDLQDAEIAAVAPKIMQVLLGRIQGAYMTFAEMNPSDPVLRKFSNLSKQITDIGRAMG
ncbi:hypothetical protein K461DRAFT_275065 [Myriangium duriaei CBS 260.36]|uniref:EDC4-like protein pdc1 beta-propeller domain-containing protein n=1 Tax=Myriangium duriaei CBS 260.36 TaxID=1168546 RepID=A0A9P4MN92_9PEZI|nr:hypothetical protein K461DRAFT_275065 [Myriangium duriaei CBS 260.36]